MLNLSPNVWKENDITCHEFPNRQKIWEGVRSARYTKSNAWLNISLNAKSFVMLLYTLLSFCCILCEVTRFLVHGALPEQENVRPTYSSCYLFLPYVASISVALLSVEKIIAFLLSPKLSPAIMRKRFPSRKKNMKMLATLYLVEFTLLISSLLKK